MLNGLVVFVALSVPSVALSRFLNKLLLSLFDSLFEALNLFFVLNLHIFDLLIQLVDFPMKCLQGFQLLFNLGLERLASLG